MSLPNLSKLQKLNDVNIFSKISALSVNTPENRGEDLAGSDIENILYDWADEVVTALKVSVAQKGFNLRGPLGQNPAEPLVIDRAGVLKVLQLDLPDEWIWAEGGRKKGKRPPVKPIENWITYRGINVQKVRSFTTIRNGKTVKPYKNITNTLKLRHIMAEAISVSIGRNGTIKRFGYKGSNYFSSVVNQESLNQLAVKISEVVGYKIGISIAKVI